VGWVDATGNLWLHGGQQSPLSGSVFPVLNDLWKYDLGNRRWTWMKGTNTGNAAGIYSAQGVITAVTRPGGRFLAHAWTDAQGDLWLYGGTGHAEEGVVGELSALWRYQIEVNRWTWMNGTTGAGQVPVLGAVGSYDPGNSFTPGGRHAASGWVTTPNRLWLFGGNAYDATTGDHFYNQLWQLAELAGIGVASNGATIGNHGTAEIGTSVIGTGVTRTFTIANTGLTTLGPLTVTVQNPHNGAFAVTTPPSGPLAPGQTNSFQVTFTARKNLARLQPDGTLDETFHAGVGPDNYVECFAVQPDGKILVGGQSTTFAGQPHAGLVRLKTDGSLDETFDPGTGAAGGSPMIVAALGLQPDGRIVVAGGFLTFNGQPRANVARLLADGSFDPDFAAEAGTDYSIQSLALQADGKMIFGGYFTLLNGHAVNALGRLNADGTFDTTFQPASSVSNGIYSLVLLQDGGLLSAGQASAADWNHSSLALRANDPATQSLAPFSGSVARWLRGGAGPELARVNFDLSTDGGAHWTALGEAGRIAGGWELAGQTIPINGHLRARGHMGEGYRNASSSLLEQVASFSRAPEIAITDPFGNELVAGIGSVEYPMRIYPPFPVIGPWSLGFNVRNVGNADLTGFNVTIGGENAVDWFYNGPFSFPPSTTIPAGGFRSMLITFTPTAVGPRTAIIHVASSDADESTFDITVTGLGITRQEGWRYTHFGTTQGTGSAADHADPDGDGNDNTLEFLAGLDPNDPRSHFILRLEAVDGEPTHRKIIFTGLPLNLTFGPAPTVELQYRTSLTEGEWQVLTTTFNSEFSSAEWWTIDTDAGGPAKYYRVQITEP
jgi:uncharacterized delta-60 repeat protein